MMNPKADMVRICAFMTGLQLRMSDPVQENWCTQTSYTDKPYICFEAVYFKGHFASHDIPILVKSPIKLRLRPDISMVVDLDVKQQNK